MLKSTFIKRKKKKIPKYFMNKTRFFEFGSSRNERRVEYFILIHFSPKKKPKRIFFIVRILCYTFLRSQVERTNFSQNRKIFWLLIII